MSDIFVKFNIRHVKTLTEVNMKLPEGLNELIDSLVNKYINTFIVSLSIITLLLTENFNILLY